MSGESSNPPPGLVPCAVSINFTLWEQHEDRLNELAEECPDVRLGGKEGKNSPRAVPHKEYDEWGCLWHFPGRGLDGQVVEHPLASWDNLKTWQPPSPTERIDALKQLSADQRPRQAWLEHGFLFLRLTYLRGFENFMVDVALEEPRLYELCEMVTDYWYRLVAAHVEAGATHVGGGDDLGLQERLPLSPAAWRKLLKPGFKRIFGVAREHGATVHFHTDGYVVDIIPDLIEAGVTSLNPQDLVNGLDNLARLAKGKVHLNLDIDRQRITAFGTPAEIDAHIRRCIETLGSPAGGLSLIWGVYPGTPLENIEAGVRAMQKYHALWVE